MQNDLGSFAGSMSADDSLTYHGAVLYAEFGDLRSDNATVGVPLRYDQLHTLSNLVGEHGGMLIDALSRRMSGLFPDAELALSCARGIAGALSGAGSDEDRRPSYRIVLGFGAVKVLDGRLKSDWTFRMPALATLLPIDSIGATAAFAEQLGPAGARLKPVANAREPLFVITDEQPTEATRAISKLALASSRVFTMLTLKVHGERLSLRSSDCPVVFGRERSCGVVLTAETASRVHGRVTFERGKFNYTDSSRNGTYVLTATGEEVFLRGESIVLIGEGALSPGAAINQQTGELIRFRSHSTRLSLGGADDVASPLRPGP